MKIKQQLEAGYETTHSTLLLLLYS